MRILCAHGPRMVASSLGILLAMGPTDRGIAAQDVLYGMNDVDQHGGPDEIVEVDPTTGVATRLHVFPDGLDFLESLAYDARESMLWTTNDGVLHRIDPRTFEVFEVGDTGNDDIDGLAVQPDTGLLYGITHGGNDLLLIDKSDAGTTVVNGGVEQGSRLEDLAFDHAGHLFILTSRALVRVDPTDGSRILKVRLHGASSLEGLVWWSERGTFLSAADRGRFKDLVTVGLNGEVEFVSAEHSGFRDIEALAFVPGESEVPVAMHAVASRRDGAGAYLVWAAYEAGLHFVVQRATDAFGPWTTIARVSLPVGGRPGGWRYEHLDPEASGAALASRDLHYRVGAQDEAGDWSWVLFTLQAAPAAVVLKPNFPNPFNPSTAFEVQLQDTTPVEVIVYDVRGRVVQALRTSQLGPGTHRVTWDGRDVAGRPVASGVYPYVVRAGQETLRGRAVVTK
ncbi:MAG: FlgD immunoglobulin-like domain containing protein [Candidatus Krumholzibacteriia bacterium]